MAVDTMKIYLLIGDWGDHQEVLAAGLTESDVRQKFDAWHKAFAERGYKYLHGEMGGYNCYVVGFIGCAKSDPYNEDGFVVTGRYWLNREGKGYEYEAGDSLAY